MGGTPGHRPTLGERNGTETAGCETGETAAGGGAASNLENAGSAETAAAETPAAETQITGPAQPLFRTRPRHGRPFNTSTKLGKMIKARGMTAREVAHAAGMSERMMTELLAGRRRVSPVNATYFAAILSCDPADVIE